MQFTGIHIPLSSFFPLAAFLLVLCPREYVSWSCAFSFAEWTGSELWQSKTPTLTTLNFPNCLSVSQEEEGESTCMKSSFVSGGNKQLILHKSIRDPLWKAFFQLDFITSIAVMCKKPDFPSCCLQTIAFWWEQVQLPLAPILFLKQRLLLSRVSKHSTGNTGTLCPMSGFFYNQNLTIPLPLQTDILKTKTRSQCIS